jgi:hypothetical protein
MASRVLILMLILMPFAMSVAACAGTGLGGSSPASLVVATLEGQPGAGGPEAAFSHTLASDVFTDDGVVEDRGRVTLALALKDPGTVELPTRPSPLNTVTVERYRVRYFRSDGRNVPGLDVPHAFDGAMTMAVGADGATGTLVLVRAQAKLEAPLVGLRDFQAAVVLSTLAEVTFYGRDQAGHAVSVSGLVGINFADWPDPE